MLKSSITVAETCDYLSVLILSLYLVTSPRILAEHKAIQLKDDIFRDFI